MTNKDYAQEVDHLGKPWLLHVQDIATIQVHNRLDPKREGWRVDKIVRKRKEQHLLRNFGLGSHRFGKFVVHISPASNGGHHVQVGVDQEKDKSKPPRYKFDVVDTLFPGTNKVRAHNRKASK